MTTSFSSASREFSHDAHSTPPYDDASLNAQRALSHELLDEHKRWRQDFLGLHLRTVLLPQNLVDQGFSVFSQTIDVATMRPWNADKEPLLGALTDFATRAGVAALLLYRMSGEKMTNHECSQHAWALAYYRGYIVRRALVMDIQLTDNDLRFLALRSTLHGSAGAPQRDWPALMKDDPRWCLAAAKEEWPALMEAYPSTREYLVPFGDFCEVASRVQALEHVWYGPPLEASLDLPASFCDDGP